MKKSIILEIEAKGHEEYDPGDYETPSSSDWWYDVQKILWDGFDVTEIFKEENLVHNSLSHNIGTIGLFHDEVELRIMIHKIDGKFFYKEFDVTEIMKEYEEEDDEPTNQEGSHAAA
ncbi:hypothetical protein AD998_01770 [bacterium 336/3]|nr:hypothetical protein AD998_01770 [bacterium 336/3]